MHQRPSRACTGDTDLRRLFDDYWKLRKAITDEERNLDDMEKQHKENQKERKQEERDARDKERREARG